MELAETEILEEYTASILRVGVCRVRDILGYICNLKETKEGSWEVNIKTDSGERREGDKKNSVALVR
jgi:hypothetical protein